MNSSETRSNPYPIIPHGQFREKKREAKENHLNIIQVINEILQLVEETFNPTTYIV